MSSLERSQNFKVVLRGLILFLGLVCTAHAGTWTEVGDANDLMPGQITIGDGPLTVISGYITGLGDANMYEINITDPANFSATVVSSPNYPNPGLDTLLWLFASDGTGVYANDDKGPVPDSVFPGGYDFTSQLSSGNPNGPTMAGIYELAISSWRYAPFDGSGNEIFADANGDTGGGVGPSSNAPLFDWVITGTDDTPPEDGNPGGSPLSEYGAYKIDLIGAEFAVVPEPQSITLAAIGFLGLLLSVASVGSRRRHAARLAPLANAHVNR